MEQSANIPKSDPSLIKSLLKTLEILDQFAISEELGVKELGVKELSDITRLPASTVQRIVNTLESKNYLTQNLATFKYKLGPSVFNISRWYSNSCDWIDIAKAHMEKLVKAHKETVTLAILLGAGVSCLARVESPHILRPDFPMGVPFPACCTALGRSMLAFQKDIDPDELLAQISPSAHRTIIDPSQLAWELEKVRNSGYAMEDEELASGLFCIAAPVRDADSRVIAAISISIPKSRLDITAVPTLVKDILSTADGISEDAKGFFHFDKLSQASSHDSTVGIE